jgi:hypothetical protein
MVRKLAQQSTDLASYQQCLQPAAQQQHTNKSGQH